MTSLPNINIALPSDRAKAIPHRKLMFAKKLRSLMDRYDKCWIINITNVGSKQIAAMRKAFHGRARFIFGKNTLIRKVIRDYVKETRNKQWMNLMDLIKGNCGLVFTKELSSDIIKTIRSNRKQSAAKCGAIAPVDVFLPPGPTMMEPTKTALFQLMNIPTRINRGQIDIEEEVHLIKKGEKVSASEAFLLSEMEIKPFYYGPTLQSWYDHGEATVFKPHCCCGSERVAESFYKGLWRVAALCASLSYPTIINVPHEVLNAYKQTLGLCMMLDTYSFDGLEQVKNTINSMNNKNTINILNENINEDDDDEDITSDIPANLFGESSSSESDD